MATVAITRTDETAGSLRQAAARCKDAAAARRMLALALVREGASQGDAARACGMDRQTLRDWAHRYNADVLSGLVDRQGDSGPKRRLSPTQEAWVAEQVRLGPDRAVMVSSAGGVSTLPGRSKPSSASSWLSGRSARCCDGCVFRRKAAGGSDPFQPVIPTQASH